MRQALRSFFLLPLIFMLACAGAFAQGSSEVTGIVTDQTGAVVAGAKIVLIDPATTTSRTTISGPTGLYDFPGLNPANYNLKVTAKGFQAFAQTGIVVNTSATFRIDIKLTVGAEDQTVTVEADALTVQSDSNVISTLITSEDISSLATENRNVAALAALGLGVTNSMPDSNSVTSVAASWSISFNGLGQEHNVWMIDGGEAYDRGSGGKSNIMPSMDAISEFQVLASNYPPDYGISTGGTISMTLKNGTQKFHGTLFEENRNTDYNANSYMNKLSNPVTPRVATHFNIYGGNLGGPLFIPKFYNVKKNKTFFFWNEEWRKTTGSASSENPTLNAADFPTLGTDLHYVSPKFASPAVVLQVPQGPLDPTLVATLAGLGLTPGAKQGETGGFQLDSDGNPIIPHQLFDPNGVLYLNSGILPKPNTSNDQNIASASLPTDSRDDVVRIDHTINDKWQLMGHYIHDSVTTANGQPELGWLWASYNTVTSTLSNPSNGAVVKLTGTLSPNLLLEASFSYNGNTLGITNNAVGQKPASWAVTPVIPSFAITRTAMPGVTGFGAPYGTAEDTGVDPYSNAAQDYEPKVDLSYTMGKHAMKFGFSYNRYTKKQIIGGDEQGNYGFGAITGDGAMDMLIGMPTNYSQEQSTPIRHWVNQTPSAYIMDNWHLTPRLSVQLGVRYDALPHAWERGDFGSNFVPDDYLASSAPVWNGGTISSTSPGVQTVNGIPFYMNGIVLAGKNGVSRGLVKNDYGTIQPRVGFSEDLFGNGKTVLRGGFGTFYERIQGNDIYNMDGNAPYAYNLQLTNPYFSNPGKSWYDGGTVSQDSLPVFVTGLTTMTSDYKAPGSAMFSLGMQNEVAPSIVWVVQYVGNIDWHQSIARHINNAPLDTDMATRCNLGDPNNHAAGDVDCTTLENSNVYRTYQGYGDINQQENTSTATYNSLQTGLRVQNRWGLSGEVDYTWSHQIDTNGGTGTDLKDINNPFNSKYDKGSGALDRRQQLSVNYVYKLPFFSKSAGLVHMVAGGWELAGTFVDNTGLVVISGLNLNPGYDPVGLGGNYTDRPNVSGRMSYPKKFGQWFDRTKFSAPTPAWQGGADQGFGSAGKDAIVGPGRVNFTTSLYKTFAFTERVGFQLKFESFNTFNHTEFNGINATYQNPTGGVYPGTYGQVTSVWDPRNLQLGGRLTF